jgi:hypothetical protein
VQLSRPAAYARSARQPRTRLSLHLALFALDQDPDAGFPGSPGSGPLQGRLEPVRPERRKQRRADGVVEQLGVTFLQPVRPGRLLAHGRIVRRVDDIAHLEASLVDPRQQATAATATAVARVIPLQAAATAV